MDEEEFEFSRNYFLAKESGTSGKKSSHKLSDIDLVDEQVLPQFLTISLCVCMGLYRHYWHLFEKCDFRYLCAGA